jgi:hypothetical protein
LVGEDNAALLGSLLVTKIQLAAMSRADMPAEQRSPFYLYVDEFQNFATDSFATILSEARKYGLTLTVANQYTAQMSIEVKDAVFGNVGSIIAFRMGADDARVMTKYFEPKFLEYDLVHMHNRHFVVSMTIEGEKVPAFSAVSLNLPPIEGGQTEAIIANSRAVYASSREVVEGFVGERYLDMKPAAVPAPRPRPPEARPRPKPVQKAVEPEAPKPEPQTPAGALQPSRSSVSAIAQTMLLGALQTVRTVSDATEPAKLPEVETETETNESGEAKPKRKRTRRRKRKTPQIAGELSVPSETVGATPPAAHEGGSLEDDGRAVHLQR